MAFLPARDTNYRIYAKHSGKCLGVQDGVVHRGVKILQQDPKAGAGHQIFQIRLVAEDHFAISPANSGHNFDVPGGTHDNGARLCQWDRGEHQWHQRFRFVRAGDGFYCIQAVHSNKFLVVNNHAHDNNADIIQWDKNDFDAARFKIIPDGAAFDSITGRDFVGDASELLRTAVIGIAGLVPEVGSGLKFILGILWPSENVATLVWDQMKRYVNDLVRDMIKEERLKDLKLKLGAVQTSIKNYEDTAWNTREKAQRFGNVLGAFDQVGGYFTDEEYPENKLPYLVALGTLHLAVLRELYLNYEKIYLEADQQKARHLDDLRKAITKYSAIAKSIRERAMKWREDKIGVDTRKEQSGITQNIYWAAFDRYDGWRAEWSYNNTTGGQYGAERLARGQADNRLAHVRGTWGGELDRYLAPAYLWKYLDPTVSDKPKRVPVDIRTGPWGSGGKVGESDFADDPKGKPITAINIWAGTRVDGVEIFYGGVSGGVHGAPGGNHYRLELMPGERIAGMRMRGGEAVDALWFETTSGRVFGGGGRGGNYVIGDPPDDANASLYSIFGRKGSKHLAAIGCTWRYYRDE